MAEALARIDRSEMVVFTSEQKQMIRDIYAAGCPEQEFDVFMEVCRARKLNPLLKQIYLVKRWNGDLKRNVWTPQTGIDGLRTIAERTGLYDGQDDAEFEYSGDKIKLARVRIYKKGIARPFTGTAHWGEYAQLTKEGRLTKFWNEKPHVMLAKCAEALALRKAFPEDMSGLYTDAEMPAEEREVNAAPAATARATAKQTEAPTIEVVKEREKEEPPPPSDDSQPSTSGSPPAESGNPPSSSTPAAAASGTTDNFNALEKMTERMDAAKTRQELDAAVAGVAKFAEEDRAQVRTYYIALLKNLKA